MMRVIGLYRDQEDPRDIVVLCWVLRTHGYRYPHSLEARRREIDKLHAKDLVWVTYIDYVWDDDAH